MGEREKRQVLRSDSWGVGDDNYIGARGDDGFMPGESSLVHIRDSRLFVFGNHTHTKTYRNLEDKVSLPLNTSYLRVWRLTAGLGWGSFPVPTAKISHKKADWPPLRVLRCTYVSRPCPSGRLTRCKNGRCNRLSYAKFEPSNTGDHSKRGLRYTQKNYIFPYFYEQHLVLFTMPPPPRTNCLSRCVQ